MGYCFRKSDANPVCEVSTFVVMFYVLCFIDAGRVFIKNPCLISLQVYWINTFTVH